jgi:selT/selW/selH-like putative selenoprotein
VAEELREAFGIEPELSKGSEGSFDVFVNGKLVFSKFEEGRYPGIDEISEIISAGNPDTDESNNL